ncbi:hypothetical protein FLONG3_27 [Fusarium longipes]|uniref:Zn(2)-C6 fungal-type domain-containing protein n=1 Tax=Fusarium longipes TaxID=694270 RepID=A0A395TAR5_9HYPO|nr:hypothetical protein FLONG3_27 [Fusarium longipes]
MVGIAGKSKACHDCKRRRVKCDLTSPTCLRCSKAGIACRGYERSTLWVHRTQARPDVSALSVVKDARLQEREKENTDSGDCLQVLQQMRAWLDSSQRSDSVAIFRLKALSIADRIYFPLSSVRKSGGDSTSTPSSWFNAVCHMRNPSEALDHSLMAFCAIQIRVSGRSGITYDETVQLYNQALSKIIAILDSTSAGNSDESLAAIVIVSTCEVIQAMVQKRPLLLEPDIWRQHTSLPTIDDSFSELLDLVMDIPSIIASAHDHSQVINSYVDLVPTINLLIQKSLDLDNWRNVHNKSTWARTQKPVYWAIPATASNPIDDDYTEKLYPFALVFSSVGCASAWIFCFSIMLDMFDTIMLLTSSKHHENRTLLDVGRCLSNDIAPNVLDTVEMDAKETARLLCQSIEFCYRTENGTFGPQITCYAQATLLRYFERCGLTRELAWCRAITRMTGPGSAYGCSILLKQKVTLVSLW